MDVVDIANLELDSDGYIVVAPLSDETKRSITELQQHIAGALPEGSLWLPQDDQLHITFAHIVSTDSTYSEPRDVLFGRVHDAAVAGLERIATKSQPITVHFDTIEVYKGAIIIKAHDDGTYQRLRQEFVESFQLPKGSRMPPTIIHTTIVRYLQPLALDTVRAAAETKLDVTEVTNELRLIHEQKIFVQQHEVIDRFELQG